MDVKYRYGHRPGRRRRTRVLIVLIMSALIIGGIAGVVGYDMSKNRRSKTVEGTSKIVAQALDDSTNRHGVDESLFSLELPNDWKEIERVNTSNEHSITWQATKAHETNRMLKLYIDTIPVTKSINRLLPVMANDNRLGVDDISDNCATFTQGGTLDAGLAVHLKDAPAKYKGVDFICDLPRVIDNEVGTGSTEGGNSVTVKGAGGSHKYFFLFTDHNNQPNYNILINAVKSMTAK